MRLSVCVTVAVGLLASAAAADSPWRSRVDPRVLERSASAPTEFLVVLDEQADLTPPVRPVDKGVLGREVVERLQAVAARTQAPFVAALETLGLEYRAYWIANLIWVRGDLRAVERLARMPGVRRIDANPSIRNELPASPDGDGPQSLRAAGTNIQHVLADQVWAEGYDGSGVVVAGADTGYDWDHPALKNQYRGWNGVTADHNYNWHDAIHSGGGSCGADSPVPCDDSTHGTHTMGTMVGDDGGVNQIGVSPGARWIGCRNMDQQNGTPATYTECFQWFVAPTDLNGLNPDPSKAPHVINNSWYCPTTEGCAEDTLRLVVENTRAAGIVVVVSASNFGSSCSTVQYAPTHYDASFSVGATDLTDTIVGFSSRGPVTVDGSNRLKPDITAPGFQITSSLPGGGYGPKNGTSMAAPHVAGAVALLLDARPDLIGDVDTIEELLELAAVPLTSVQDCSGPGSGLLIPNNTYGAGRLDTLEVVTGDPDGDGVETRDDCLPLDSQNWDVPDPAIDLLLAPPSGTNLSWIAPPNGGGTVLTYDLLRSTQADDFSGATCVESGTSSPSGIDPAPPTGAYFYVVRVNNGCGSSMGQGTGGLRSGATCP